MTAAPGGGTQARLRLMLATVTQPTLMPTVAPVPRAEPGYAGPRRTVLVVDDDSAHRTLMRAILEPRGLTVREAETGPACLAAVGATGLILTSHTGDADAVTAQFQVAAREAGDTAPAGHVAVASRPAVAAAGPDPSVVRVRG